MMNQPTYETVTRSIPTRSQVKVRSIHPGSAVKYGTLFSLIYALLTGVPLAIVTIGVARLIISLLSPIINLFHGSVAGATANATSTTLLLLLIYVLAVTLFGCIFTLLATLVYNLLAHLTGGLALDVEDVRQAAQMAVPQEVRQAAGTATVEAEAPGTKEIAPAQEAFQAAGTTPLKEVPETKEIASSEEGAKAAGTAVPEAEGVLEAKEIAPSQEDAKAEGKPASNTEGSA